MNSQEPRIKASEIVWDHEDRADFTGKEGHIRDTTIYFTASLWAAMLAVWGVITAVITSTNSSTGDVILSKADPKDPRATPVRLVGAQNAAECSWWRPLQKLNLKVPANRQLNVTPFTQEVEGLGTVFVFPMSRRKSVPRNTKEESTTPAAGQTADVAAARQGQSADPSATKQVQPAPAAPAKQAQAPKAE